MKQMENARVVVAGALIAVGVLLLVLRAFGDFAGSVWPIFVIVPGLVLLVMAANGGGGATLLAAAGGVVTGVGVILFVQDLTDYYQSWAYAWALLPLFAGAGMLLAAGRQHDPAAAARAWGLIEWGGVAFVVMAVFFEGLIFHGFLIAGGLIMPILLIAVGALLLLGRGRAENHVDAPPTDGGPKTKT